MRSDGVTDRVWESAQWQSETTGKLPIALHCGSGFLGQIRGMNEPTFSFGCYRRILLLLRSLSAAAGSMAIPPALVPSIPCLAAQDDPHLARRALRTVPGGARVLGAGSAGAQQVDIVSGISSCRPYSPCLWPPPKADALQ